MIARIIGPCRRVIQILALTLLIALPLCAVYTHYREAHALQDLPENSWRTTLLLQIDDWVGDHPTRAQRVANTHGSFWSARLLGWSVTDPLAGLEAIASSRSFYVPLLWSLLIPVVGTLLLGRVFCGWICPMNLLLELVDKCRRVLRWLEVRERDVAFSKGNKYFLLAVALLFGAVLCAPFLAFIYPPAVISREVHRIAFGAGVGVGIYVILMICAIELFVSRRWWCRYMCPGGAVYSLLGRFRVIRVARTEDACIHCGACVTACQFDLRPMVVDVTGTECTNCGTCIQSCASGALAYRLVLPGQRPPATPRHDVVVNLPPAAPDLSVAANADGDRAEVASQLRNAARVVMLALFVWSGTPVAARAHHILGLPHYSYKENYPQVPTLEFPATTGPYDVLLTSYPGAPTPGEPATVTFYVKNRKTGAVYDKLLTLRVVQTYTFGSNRDIFGPETMQRFDNEYKFTVTFPEDGEYVAELSIEVEGRVEVIPFVMVAGNPTSTVSVLVALGGALLVFIVVVRAIKIKRARRGDSSAIADGSAGVTPGDRAPEVPGEVHGLERDPVGRGA